MITKTLHISTSPHIVKGLGTDDIMRNVVISLLPVAAFSVYAFGLNALFILLVAVLSSVMTEHLLCKWSRRQSTIDDWSAAITGLLYGLTLPPTLPLWMVFLGGVVAISLGKFMFGGLGSNAFNPALVGRAMLQAAFPVAMTTWSPALMADRFQHISASLLALPFMEPASIDGFSGATPLSAFKFDGIAAEAGDLAFGFVSGSVGETSSLIILIGALYLIARKMMNWRIPVSILATVALLSLLFHSIDSARYAGPMFMLFSGGLMLGALYMATDMVASPITSLGVIVYGVLIGALVVVIRYWGGLPEGVMYAILLANAISPHIDRMLQPRVYGTKGKAS